MGRSYRFRVPPLGIKQRTPGKSFIGLDNRTSIFPFNRSKACTIGLIISDIDGIVVGLTQDSVEDVRQLSSPIRRGGPFFAFEMLGRQPPDNRYAFRERRLFRFFGNGAFRVSGRDAPIRVDELPSHRHRLVRLCLGNQVVVLLAQPLPFGQQVGPRFCGGRGVALALFRLLCLGRGFHPRLLGLLAAERNTRGNRQWIHTNINVQRGRQGRFADWERLVIVFSFRPLYRFAGTT